MHEAEYGTLKGEKGWGGCFWSAGRFAYHYEQEYAGAYQAHRDFMKNLRWKNSAVIYIKINLDYFEFNIHRRKQCTSESQSSAG